MSKTIHVHVIFFRKDTLKKAQDMGRVRRNLYLFAVTITAGICMILIGRHERRQGHTVQQQELAKLIELREQGLRDEAAKRQEGST